MNVCKYHRHVDHEHHGHDYDEYEHRGDGYAGQEIHYLVIIRYSGGFGWDLVMNYAAARKFTTS
eukprot:3401329-Heterocapsa_arctica.AAC.1